GKSPSQALASSSECGKCGSAIHSGHLKYCPPHQPLKDALLSSPLAAPPPFFMMTRGKGSEGKSKRATESMRARKSTRARGSTRGRESTRAREIMRARESTRAKEIIRAKARESTRTRASTRARRLGGGEVLLHTFYN
ncbi:hypothetical protein DFH27DRAFT_57214, partial [Peziza echinospora]